MGDKPLCALFLWLYHLSDWRLHSVAFVMPFLGSNYSLYLDFHCPLSNREMLDVYPYFSSKQCSNRFGKEGCLFLVPDPSIGSSCSSLFEILCALLPFPGAPSFSSLWKVKILKKVEFFVWQVLHRRVNTLSLINLPRIKTI